MSHVFCTMIACSGHVSAPNCASVAGRTLFMHGQEMARSPWPVTHAVPCISSHVPQRQNTHAQSTHTHSTPPAVADSALRACMAASSLRPCHACTAAQAQARRPMARVQPPPSPCTHASRAHRYHLNCSIFLGQVTRGLKWADGAAVRAELEAQVSHRGGCRGSREGGEGGGRCVCV